TSSTARAAALEEATGAPTSRNATHTTLSTTAARSAQPRWPAATRRPRSSARRPAAMAAGAPRHAQQRQNRDREQRDDEDGRHDDDEIRARRPDGVAPRLDADPDVARVVPRVSMRGCTAGKTRS